MSKLSRDDILKLARLARISLTDEEVTSYQHELAGILEYVEQLQGADIAGLEPTSQVTGLVNVMREDAAIDYGYSPAELMKNVPQTEADQIKVKRMIS